MLREEDRGLWDLLGRVKQPEVSPFFARNVLRTIRQEQHAPATGIWRWLRPRRLVPIMAAAVILVTGSVVLYQSMSPPAQEEQAEAQASPQFDPVAKIDPNDYDVVADLDNLMASEANNPWDDDDISTL